MLHVWYSSSVASVSYSLVMSFFLIFFFFFTYTYTSEIYTLSLHDALPILLDLVGLGGKSAADKGKDTRDYLAAAFPELNAWERAGADASSAGMVDAGFENQKELTKMQLD